MNILVTGAAGFIGAALVAALAARREVERIVAFDQVAQSLHHVFGAEYHLLAQRQRRGMVVDTEGK